MFSNSSTALFYKSFLVSSFLSYLFLRERENTSLVHHSVIFLLWFCFISELLPIGIGEERNTWWLLPAFTAARGRGEMAVFIFKSLRSFLDLWYICTESRGERRLLSHHNLRGLLFNFRKAVIFDFTTVLPVFQPVLSSFPVPNQKLSCLLY
jgi:hypothetical protein